MFIEFGIKFLIRWVSNKSGFDSSAQFCRSAKSVFVAGPVNVSPHDFINVRLFLTLGISGVLWFFDVTVAICVTFLNNRGKTFSSKLELLPAEPRALMNGSRVNYSPQLKTSFAEIRGCCAYPRFKCIGPCTLFRCRWSCLKPTPSQNSPIVWNEVQATLVLNELHTCELYIMPSNFGVKEVPCCSFF